MATKTFEYPNNLGTTLVGDRDVATLCRIGIKGRRQAEHSDSVSFPVVSCGTVETRELSNLFVIYFVFTVLFIYMCLNIML